MPKTDFQALDEAIKLNKFEEYLEKSKPVKILVKKESEDTTETYAIDPDHFLVTTLGKSIIESQNVDNIKSNYQDLYENLEPKEKLLFVPADKVSKLDKKNAMAQYEKLLNALPKLQEARNTNKNSNCSMALFAAPVPQYSFSPMVSPNQHKVPADLLIFQTNFFSILRNSRYCLF